MLFDVSDHCGLFLIVFGSFPIAAIVVCRSNVVLVL